MKKKKAGDIAYELPQAKPQLDGHRLNDRANQIYSADRPVHSWYRFVLSFPPHLVRDYLKRFGLNESHRVLDPFCGTGTTLVECKKLGVPSVGVEANPMAHFASLTKVDWSPDPDLLWQHATHVANSALTEFSLQGLHDEIFSVTTNGHLPTQLRILPEAQMELLLSDSISPLPLHKTLVLLDYLKRYSDARFEQHELLALAKVLVTSISNLHFGPEVGVGPPKLDAVVVPAWLEQMQIVCSDLRQMSDTLTPATILLGDSRQLLDMIEPQSIDAVITSPPYPNEKDYTRTTRLESVLLELIRNKADLRALKRGLIRSNTRGVSVEDDDDTWVAQHPEIQRIASDIEARRISMGKTSGFERLYARVTKLYFGGMVRHLSDLRHVLKPGAHLAYVVGDQASYLRVMIRTGQLLGQIAQSLGYELESIDLFRTRLATATREQLREEVVVLKWPKQKRSRDRQIQTSNTMANPNRYTRIIERIFVERHTDGVSEIEFTREDLVAAADALGIKLPKNLGDVIYSFRYRIALPDSIKTKAPSGMEWIIRPAGQAKYRFVAVAASSTRIAPNPLHAVTKVPDSTPGLIAAYALSDEQSLLAKVRYNRLIDIFTGVTCYSLQNHLRTTVPNMGQVETDEIYIGVDKRGSHYVFPVQAKGGKDQISIVQIEQDFALCAAKFPSLICQPIAAQFAEDDRIALFKFEMGDAGLSVSSERHYKLVPPDEVTAEDLQTYRARTDD